MFLISGSFIVPHGISLKVLMEIPDFSANYLMVILNFFLIAQEFFKSHAFILWVYICSVSHQMEGMKKYFR